MKVVFKIVKAGSGNDIYFERLSQALKTIHINSEIQYYPKIFQFFPWALKLVNKQTAADIVHTNAEYGWVFKEKGKPLYVTLHHNVFDEAYRPYTTFLQRLFHDFVLKPNIRRSLDNASKIIAVSNYTKNSFIHTFGIYPIEVIYNFVDTDKYKPISVKSDDKRFKLLFVGNLIRRKGADLLPKIMEKLGDEYVLYYTSGLRTKIPKEFNLPNMIPLGRLSEEELIREYNKCDALLFPSRFEGFGYAIAEAMACGKPVIATDSSSIPELIAGKENGILCHNENINEFVKNAVNLKIHPDSYKNNHVNYRNVILKKFAFLKFVNNYEKIYSK